MVYSLTTFVGSFFAKKPTDVHYEASD